MGRTHMCPVKVGGRSSIAPGVYFRMLLIGYFEGLNSERGIARGGAPTAFRCASFLDWGWMKLRRITAVFRYGASG